MWALTKSLLTLLTVPSILAAGNVSDIVFRLFTRSNPTEHQVLVLDDPLSIDRSNFDRNLPIKIFAHGMHGTPDHGNPIRDEYLLREPLNFIAVDWRTMSAGLNYPYIILVNVPAAGDHVGRFVDFLVGQGVALDSVHLIGWSLGAHVVGNAGEAVHSGVVPRITGLDPAGPGFVHNETSMRLDASDAAFVDVIQTNSGSLIAGGLGYGPPLGHVDFYPNGGERQPGCPDQDCNHRRCVDYFAESINSGPGFGAVECDSWTHYVAGDCASGSQLVMGDLTPTTSRGVFYLATNSEPPFALG